MVQVGNHLVEMDTGVAEAAGVSRGNARVLAVYEPGEGRGAESIHDADRFTSLFADLEAAAAGTDAWADDINARELQRAEFASVLWSDRVRAASHAQVQFSAVHGEPWTLTGEVERVGMDALFMHAAVSGDGLRQHWAVALRAVQHISDLGSQSRRPGVVDARLGLASALREWSANHVPLTLVHSHRLIEGSAIRVGRDHVDVAEHDVRVIASARQIRRISTIPIGRIFAVRHD